MISGASRKRWWWFGGLSLVVLILVGVSVLARQDLWPGGTLEASERSGGSSQDAAGEGEGLAALNQVSLTEAKIQAAAIEVVPAEITTLTTELALPATLDGNADRRVDIRPRVMGVIREVRTVLGQVVRAGDVLAVLDSPDVGTARLDLRARQLDLNLARMEAEWASTVAANVEELLSELDKQVSAKTLEARFAARPLGDRRSELLAAYAELEIARREETKQTDLFRRGLVGDPPAQVAIHAREGAQAKFEAAKEQVRFEAVQEKRRADQAVSRAQSAVVDASQRLRILGADGSSSVSNSSDDEVTLVPIVAPFDGTITARSAVPGQRVETSDALFTLVDLTTVRVQAHVPESSMAALASLSIGHPLTILTTAYGDRTFEAKVIYIGAEVDPQTRTVPLLAEVPNPDGLLRPGMFARISLTGIEAEQALTVPSAAVVEIDGEPIVFVPGTERNHFVLRRVHAGRESAGRRVITAGLKPEDLVVGSGAFTLKSEWILQTEPDDE